MLPQAVASRSSERWSHIWSEASDGFARSRSPSSTSWRVPAMRSSRVTPARPRARIIASRSARARRVHGPGSPSPIGSPSKRVTGRIPATLEHRNASSAAARSSGVRRPSTGRSPTLGAQASSHDRVVPGRIAQSSDGVASSGRPSPSRASDEEDVGRRAFRQVVVDGQEQCVVGAGAARLEPGVDVVRPRRRLERRQRVGRIAPDRRRDEVEPAREMIGVGRDDRPGLDGDGRCDDLVGRQEAASRGTGRATR